MGSRRKGRIEAVCLLFQMDVCKNFDQVETVIERHFAHLAPESTPETRTFSEALCRGVVEKLEYIDEIIESSSTNWRMERMSEADRNILRLATYELSMNSDLAPQIIINEAIELGKMFGSEESSGFINGVLDGVLRKLGVRG
ncbi:MAG: transcription antitermination factor NusB [Pseudomonadota bacterium]